MDHDYDISDRECPVCANPQTHRRDCPECDDGMVDDHEEDPINHSPGEFSRCNSCGGKGIEQWCPHCGLNLVDRDVLLDRVESHLSRLVACRNALDGMEHLARKVAEDRRKAV